jgi:NAD(P)-dependent dehydrogenase (short-subunit alcohol dehydrogenase family)
MAISGTRSALITGSSSGIGLAVARALGEDGYRLTLAARGRDGLDDAATGLRRQGFTVETAICDVCEERQVIDLFAAQRRTYGELHVLVNNAGRVHRTAIDAIDADELDIQFAANLRSFMLCTREGLPMLRESAMATGKALIVNTASVVGKGGHPGSSVYAAMKAAVVNFSRSTHEAESDNGVQCTVLLPGYVNTPLVESIKERIPGDAMVQPSDLGEAVRFLLRTSPNCHIPEITFLRRGAALTTP